METQCITWTIQPDPFNNIGLSAAIAAIPILYLFWALACKRMKGHWAAVSALGITLLIAFLAYRMPVKYGLLSTAYGMLFGLWPVCWIVVTAVFIYNLSVKTGQFEIIKNSLATISDDRRMQALLIAFSFGAFIEGAAGFGTPVAITAAMLAGLGFQPIYASGICLLANTAPVAFGAIGIPIIVGAQVSGVDQMALSQMVGRTLPFISGVIPFYMIVLMSGWKKGLEVWPAALVSGGSFAITQWWSSNYLGPLLPDILASIASIVCMVTFLRFWHPKESWHFDHEAKSTGRAKLLYTGGQVFRAWAPFIILSIFVAAWGVKPVKNALDYLGMVKLPIPELHDMIIRDGKPLSAVFTFNILSAAGTAILFAGFFSIPVMGASLRTAGEVAAQTIKKLLWPVFTISSILGFAYIMNFSGMAITLGNAFAKTGVLFPFFAAFLGWLGVFMTGSDTSSNAFFGKLQEVTATQLGIDPVVTVGANSSGGVCGKMISPQSLSVATAAVGLIGHEADIFRFTLKHSIILTTVVGIMTMLQAYVIKWIVPTWTKTATATSLQTTAATQPLPADGISYLAITVILVTTVTLAAIYLGKAKNNNDDGK